MWPSSTARTGAGRRAGRARTLCRTGSHFRAVWPARRLQRRPGAQQQQAAHQVQDAEHPLAGEKAVGDHAEEKRGDNRRERAHGVRCAGDVAHVALRDKARHGDIPRSPHKELEEHHHRQSGAYVQDNFPQMRGAPAGRDASFRRGAKQCTQLARTPEDKEWDIRHRVCCGRVCRCAESGCVRRP